MGSTPPPPPPIYDEIPPPSDETPPTFNENQSPPIETPPTSKKTQPATNKTPPTSDNLMSNETPPPFNSTPPVSRYTLPPKYPSSNLSPPEQMDPSSRQDSRGSNTDNPDSPSHSGGCEQAGNRTPRQVSEEQAKGLHSTSCILYFVHQCSYTSAAILVHCPSTMPHVYTCEKTLQFGSEESRNDCSDYSTVIMLEIVAKIFLLNLYF